MAAGPTEVGLFLDVLKQRMCRNAGLESEYLKVELMLFKIKTANKRSEFE
jgi:hypothetical protein